MEKFQSILLVDDDPVANFIHEDIFASLAISDEIKIATNGVEALKIVEEGSEKNECPQLILLDLNMPIMDGFEFLEGFKKLPLSCQNSKVIIVSSSDNFHDLERAKNFQVDDYIIKPLTEQKIQEWIHKYFRERNV